MPAAKVAALAQEMLERTTRRNPAWATDLGIHDWDHEVADPSRAAVLEDTRLHEAWLARAEALAREALPLEARIDLAALTYALRLWLFEERELRRWERNPDLAMEFLDHVFGLLVKEELPPSARGAAIAARLEKAAGFLAAGRDRFRAGSCPQLWVDMALESAAGAPALLDAAEKLAQRPEVGAAVRERTRAAVKEAREAFKAHEDWLQGLRRGAEPGGWATGAARFRDLVALRQLGADDEAILARGHALVAELRRETARAAEDLVRASGEAPGPDPVARAQELLQAEHPPDWPGVLGAYREAIAASRAFVQERGLATLPPGERLEVIETPAYLRHVMPFAAYVAPGKFERRQVGLYMVTPREPRHFPLAEVLNTTVHEGYPGHHLQLSGANRNPSVARLFVHATEAIEGWAHYCEDLMLGRGFTHGARPEAVRFVVRKDQLWRACRIVIDVGIHRGAMGFDEGWQMLRDVARMDEPQARAELKRYTQSPAYQLSYLWGKDLIQRLRAEADARGMAERDFHDRYVAAGSLPLGLMRQALGL